METPIMSYENELNLKATELRLGLPGSENGSETRSDSLTLKNNKRTSSEISKECSSSNSCVEDNTPTAPPAKAQIVGWPPVRSYRKNCLQSEKNQTDKCGMYVKVSVDGAPYLRKIDLKVYKSYAELLKALENMFKLTIGKYSERDGHKGSDYAPTYEDKDGDWMLVGDVPWNMFVSSCKRLRIMKGSEAKGLSC